MIIPTLTPEEVEDRAHPLRVAPGEVVVDGDDVDAAAGQRVEDRGQRSATRVLPSPVRISAILPWWRTTRADQLDVEVAHPERPLHRLAGHREDLGQDVVEGRLEALVLALAARLGQLAAALEVGVVELVLGRLVGHGDLADLVAELGERGRGSPRRRGPRISASSSLVSSTRGWMRRISRSFESTNIGKEIAWPAKYRVPSRPGSPSFAAHVQRRSGASRQDFARFTWNSSVPVVLHGHEAADVRRVDLIVREREGERPDDLDQAAVELGLGRDVDRLRDAVEGQVAVEA